MSVVSEVKAELSAIEAKAGELAAKLEPEAARLEALAGNPVVDALLEFIEDKLTLAREFRALAEELHFH